MDAGRPQRRELLRRVGGLGVAVDQAAGEISGLPFRPRAMQAAVAGLLGALSAWRLVATHLERRPGLLGPGEAAERVRALLPPSVAGPPSSIREAWGRDPERARSECLAAARELAAMPAETVSARLLAEGMAEGLLALGRVLVGVALLSPAAGRSEIPGGAARLPVPDLLPPLINLLRAVLTIGVAQLIWVVTAWPSGALMVVFASVTVILFAPREDAAYGMARSFLLGTSITAVLAAVIAFAVLPQREGFGEFCIAIGLVLVPAGALSAQAWQQPVFVAVAANFIPLLAPSNPMSYDLGTFYNTALALLAGVGMTALAFRLIPPLPPPLRARRLLALTLRDLRRLAGGRDVPIATWEARIYARLGVMPDQADPLQHARLVTALAVGTEILRLRRLTGRLGLEAALAPALDAVRRGDSAAAAAGFSGVDRALAALPDAVPTRQTRLRARGSALALVEALSAHALYFDAHPPR